MYKVGRIVQVVSDCRMKGRRGIITRVDGAKRYTVRFLMPDDNKQSWCWVPFAETELKLADIPARR